MTEQQKALIQAVIDAFDKASEEMYDGLKWQAFTESGWIESLRDLVAAGE